MHLRPFSVKKKSDFFQILPILCFFFDRLLTFKGVLWGS